MPLYWRARCGPRWHALITARGVLFHAIYALAARVGEAVRARFDTGWELLSMKALGRLGRDAGGGKAAAGAGDDHPVLLIAHAARDPPEHPL